MTDRTWTLHPRADLQPLLDQIGLEGSHYEWDSSGYACFILRTKMLNWCGYVSVPSDHPWHGLGHDSYVTPLPERDAPQIAPPVISILLEAMNPDAAPEGQAKMDLCVVVHGGLTWSGERSGLREQLESEQQWTFGFDCGHAGDVVPALHAATSVGIFDGDVYRDRDYVIGETSRLAAQLRIVHRRGYR